MVYVSVGYLAYNCSYNPNINVAGSVGHRLRTSGLFSWHREHLFNLFSRRRVQVLVTERETRVYDTILTVMKGRILARNHDLLFNLPQHPYFLSLSADYMHYRMHVAEYRSSYENEISASVATAPPSLALVSSRSVTILYATLSIPSHFVFNSFTHSTLDNQNTMFP